MSSPIFVLFGSGPGIGIAVAKAFAQKHLDRIVLCSRSADRLTSEKTEVEEAARKHGRTVDVFTFQTDLSNLDKLRSTLKEIEQVGPLGLVYHNAARIRRTEVLTMPPEEIEEDFKTGNLSLYVIAQWAIPLLQASNHPSPSFFVTNSHLPEAPLPEVLSLSMSKASQQNMFMSLNKAFGKDVHFGLVKACGIVAPAKEKLNPTFIAGKAVELYEQAKGEWELSVEIRE